MQQRSATRVRTGMVPIAVVAFVVLGLTESGLGTAWPAMRRTVGRPVEDLGTLLAVGLSAYAVSSAVSGAVVRRLGTGRSVLVAGVLSLAGLTTYAATDTWPGVVAAALLLGTGSGTLDSTLNAHAAHHYTAGATNLLHAGFGVGATLGPLVMAAAVSRASGWQIGYVAFALVQGLMLLVLFAVRRRWLRATVDDDRPAGRARPDAIVIAGLAMFFLYTGIEVTAGQWSFSVLTESRGLGTESGGAWVAAFWGGLMAGRLGLSGLADILGAKRVMTLSMAGALLATGWFWWDAGGLGLVALPALGVSLAGIFPTLVTLTPQRIGPERTTSMVGYQLAAASVGAAALPWVAGRLVAASSLAVVAPFLLATTAAMTVLNAWLDRRT